MKHIMIDLETLGVGHNVPIFEIGLTVFDLPANGLPPLQLEMTSKQIDVDIMDVMWRTGFCPQPGTLDWWRTQQYDPSKTRLVDRVSLSDALSETVRVFREFEPEFVWANSPSFDLVILEQHFAAVGMKKPWTYKQELDWRTLKWLARQHGFVLPDGGPNHKAVDDSDRQTEILKEMLRHVRTL